MASRITTRSIAGFLSTLALVSLMAILSSSRSEAQSFGSIVGTVTDASGAVVPGATITVTNTGTNETRTVKSSAAGDYQVVNLQPAVYKVQVQATNFKRFVSDRVEVQVGSAFRVNVALQVGSATETVEVNTQAPLLQTESGTLGSQVEGKTVQAMPLNGRNTMALIALVPGVVPQGSTSGGVGLNQGDHTNNSGWGNYQIGGSIAGHGVVFVDGAPNNSLGGNTVGFVPVQDAVQEFKVSTSAISPEFGRFGGGVVEMSTKSGSNAWHGTAYEFFRNTVLDTNTYGWNASNAASGSKTRQKLNQNQYGGLVSGPAIKNKAFFMFNYEGFKVRSGLSDAFNIPDAGMMSDTDPSVPWDLTAASSDPNKTISNWTKGSCITGYTNGRTHFKPSCIDPDSKLFKEFYPDVNQAKSATNPIQFYNGNPITGQAPNYNVAYVVGVDTSQYNARGDVNLGAKQHIFGRYSHMSSKDIPADEVLSAHGYKTANAGSNYFTHQGVLGDTVTINPTTIADFRLSFLRNYNDNMQQSAGDPATKTFISSLGAGWAPVSAAASQVHLPKPQIGPFGPGGRDGLYTFRAMGGWSWGWSDSTSFSANITKIRGSHTIKFGGEIRFMDQTSGGVWTPDGGLNFGSDYTTDEWANFLLGLPDSVNISTSASSGAFNWYQGYYGSDTWTVNRKLTLSAGVRWELPGAVAERKNNSTVLLPDYISSSGIRGTLALTNSNLWKDRTTEPALHALLSPRVGFAYRVKSDLVVRGGYSLTYLAPDLGTVLPGNSIVNSANTSANNPQQSQNPVLNPSAVYYTTSNPFGSGANAQQIFQPVGRKYVNNFAGWFQSGHVTGQADDGYSGQDISGPVPTNTMSYMEQWNLAVGRQFKGQQSVEVGYAGALAIHLLPAGGSWGIDQPTWAQIAVIKNCPNDDCVYQNMPYPNYHSVSNSNAYNGTINYNSLQIRYEKRFAAGAAITSGYTFSKSLGDSDTTMSWLDSGADGMPQDYNNIKGEHSILSYSIKNRWVSSFVLDLPVGKGKKYFNNENGIVDRVIGGWGINGITTLQSGQHLLLTDGNGDALAGSHGHGLNAGQLRPDYIADCDKLKGIGGSQQKRMNGWFNTACFLAPDANPSNPHPGPYALGNEPRVDSNLVGSGIANWDFTAQKTTRITEKTNLEFRMEFYNLFNRRQWNLPNGDVSSPGFGTINDQQNNPRQMQASLRFNF